MWKKVLNCIISILFILSLIMNGILGCQNYRYRNTQPEKIEIHDSIFVPKDSIITKTKYKTVFDTIVEIQYKDTVLHDTIYMPIEHKVSEFNLKKDSFELKQKIHHSGWHSNIDSVECSYSFNYEITKPKPKRIGLVWCIGPYVGYGINFHNGQYYFSPEVGIGGSIGIGGIIK